MRIQTIFRPSNPLAAVLESLGGSGLERIAIVVAYVTRKGLMTMEELLRKTGLPPEAITIVSGSDVVACDHDALFEYAHRHGWRIRRHPEPLTGRFHPKVYLAANAAGVTSCCIGSQNATGAAFEVNDEAGIVVTGSADQQAIADVHEAVASWIEASVPLEEGFVEQAVECKKKNGVGAATVSRTPSSPMTATEAVRFLMTHPEHAPCLRSLGADETAMDLALAFDYLRSVKGVDLPLDLCLNVVRRCNLPSGEFEHIPADLHRPFHQLKAERPPAWEPIEPGRNWPARPEADVPMGPVREQFEWLFADPRRSPLSHSLRSDSPLEWAYTLDYLYVIGRVPIPWAVARSIVRRSQADGVERIVQPDGVRGAMKKAPEYLAYRAEKGWA